MVGVFSAPVPCSGEAVRGFLCCPTQSHCLSGIHYGAFGEECSNGKRMRAADLQIQWFFSALYIQRRRCLLKNVSPVDLCVMVPWS